MATAVTALLTAQLSATSDTPPATMAAAGADAVHMNVAVATTLTAAHAAETAETPRAAAAAANAVAGLRMVAAVTAMAAVMATEAVMAVAALPPGQARWALRWRLPCRPPRSRDCCDCAHGRGGCDCRGNGVDFGGGLGRGGGHTRGSGDARGHGGHRGL